MRNCLLIFVSCLSFTLLGQKQVYISSSTGFPDYIASLFLVDADSCAANFIGLTDFELNDIAINPTNDELYGVGNHEIYRVDKTNASLTLLANTTITLRGLTFSSNGTLYSTDDGHTIYKIDTTDGSSNLAGYTFEYGGHDLTFYNCSLIHNTPYPDPALVQGDPNHFNANFETNYSADGTFPGDLFPGLATLGCPPSIYGFNYTCEVWRFTEDLLTTEQVCSNLLPMGQIVSGAAAVYDETNCEFEQHGVIDMPNVFTPNSDNINDIFFPRETCGVESSNLKILNRWGELVFETNDISSGWDGMHNGVHVSDGTYFWVVTFSDDAFEPARGVLQLIR